MRRETQRLANVMRSSPKARGRWGEEQLRNILESAGLGENVDFHLQSAVNDGERQLRPDCVISLPGGRCIVIDVKCPLVHFEQAFDEEDEALRTTLLKQHADAMKSYANDLGRKGYWRQFDLSPDFVIMFIPGEHFLSAAAERAPDLIESAYRNGVIIASTINMLALAKVMAGMWRQEALAAQAKEVAQIIAGEVPSQWTGVAHPFEHPSEHGIAEFIGRVAPVIQRRVVREVDVPLRGRASQGPHAGHRPVEQVGEHDRGDHQDPDQQLDRLPTLVLRHRRLGRGVVSAGIGLDDGRVVAEGRS